MKHLLLLFVLFAALALPGAEAQVQLSGTLSGSQEVPAFATNATGTFEGIFDPWSKTIAFRVDFSGFTTNVVAAHFHAAATGVNGPVTLDLAPQGFPIGGTSGAFVKVLTLSDAQAKDLIEGRMYINIHTQLKQSGEIRGQINYGKRPPNQPVQVRGVFSGDQEVPAVQTTATGKFDGIFDPGSRKLAFRIDFSGLTTNTVSAHFHTGAAGVGGPVTLDAAPLGFPFGVTAGSLVAEVTLTEAQAKNLAEGKIYFNIHSDRFRPGEIRAQLNYDRPASAAPVKVTATLDGAQETPSVTTPGKGTLDGVFDPVTRALAFKLDFSDLTTPTLFAHFHRGALGVPGPVTIDLVPAGFPVGVTAGTMTKLIVISESQAKDLMDGNMYINIHSQQFRPGEIRGQLNVQKTQNVAAEAAEERGGTATVLNEIAVWPNPASEAVNLALPDSELAFEARVFDLTGRQLRRTEGAGATGRIELAGLERGIYVLQVQQGAAHTAVKLVVR
jgi:CHRD domain/Secretion system C-terminal sorting domain